MIKKEVHEKAIELANELCETIGLVPIWSFDSIVKTLEKMAKFVEDNKNE